MILSMFIIFLAVLAAGILFVITSFFKLILSMFEEGREGLKVAVEVAVFFIAIYFIGYFTYGIMAKEFWRLLIDLISAILAVIVLLLALVVFVMFMGYFMLGMPGFVMEYAAIGVAGKGFSLIRKYGISTISFLATVSDKGFHKMISVIGKQVTKLTENV